MSGKTKATVSVTEWLDPKESEAYTGFTSRTLRTYTSKGVLPGYRSRGGRGIRYKRSDLDRLFVRVPAAGSLGGESVDAD